MRIDAAMPMTAIQSNGAGSIAAQRTPVSQADLRSAIGRAFQTVNGRPASSKVLDMRTAQASLEAGRGAQMYNYNFGGIKGAEPVRSNRALHDP